MEATAGPAVFDAVGFGVAEGSFGEGGLGAGCAGAGSVLPGSVAVGGAVSTGAAGAVVSGDAGGGGTACGWRGSHAASDRANKMRGIRVCIVRLN
jgi:hypothetical protein